MSDPTHEFALAVKIREYIEKYYEIEYGPMSDRDRTVAFLVAYLTLRAMHKAACRFEFSNARSGDFDTLAEAVR